MSDRIPEWFTLTEEMMRETNNRIASSVNRPSLPLQIANAPRHAHWFILNSLFTASHLNRDGMHAEALSITRQCIEATSVLELGVCCHIEAPQMLAKWEAGNASPGELRKWLSQNVWPSYGSGLWSDSWSDFMGQLAGAVQPYAHYTPELAKWQYRLHALPNTAGDIDLFLESTPRAYDPQKATRITLFHSILTFALARIWIANSTAKDLEHRAVI